MLNIFQTKDFYFFRKPHWVASTFWKEKSFLDYVFIDNTDIFEDKINYNNLTQNVFKYINEQFQTLKIEPIQNINKQHDIIQNLIHIFWKDKEYW